MASRLRSAESPEGRALLDGPLADTALPAVLLWDGRVLAAPTPPELVEALGVRTDPAGGTYYVTVVGGGPAGLAAAVYAASEGLRTMLLEVQAVGGQAGTRTKIRDYLGFLWGVRGADLAQMAHRQAEQLGAEIVATRAATTIEPDGRRPFSSPCQARRSSEGGEWFWPAASPTGVPASTPSTR